MFCERVIDVNSKLFELLEENQLIDQEEKEIYENYSSKNKNISNNTLNYWSKQYGIFLNWIKKSILMNIIIIKFA